MKRPRRLRCTGASCNAEIDLKRDGVEDNSNEEPIVRKHLIVATFTSVFLTIARASPVAAPAIGQTVNQPWPVGNASDHNYKAAAKPVR